MTKMTKTFWIIVDETKTTSSSAMAERPREFGDFKGVGQFEAKF